MRVVLDECLPRRLMRDLRDHSVTTVPRQGWAGRTNGELLALVKAEFDVFVTLDKSIENQQKIGNRDVCIIVLRAANSRYETLAPLIPGLLEAVSRAKAGSVIRLGR